MFKCPNCAEPLTVRDKFKFIPGKLIKCKKCCHELKLFKAYYYATFFVAASGSSLFVNQFGLNELNAAGLTFACCFLWFICQPIRKA
ncbi:hypothetical protein BCT01_23705 [Vibrio tasmaniensis]|nr:hypothetical protein A152_20835 [Vibrio tasmaniensis 1F-187]OEF76592.1 hypothetical protein A162_17395 [Vibrio tasmaniensis 1F-155]PMO85639.1 hypothetical protein BCT01_23705 [Vibrio tasmaniensis]